MSIFNTEPQDQFDKPTAECVWRDYSHCRACGRRIEWFWTKNNRKMPFSLKMEVLSVDPPLALPSMTRYEPHVAVCSGRKQWAKRR